MTLRLRAALRVWTPRLIALLIALELGLLSPLSCAIHCVMQRLLAERPASALFLCGEHAAASAPSQSTAPHPSSTITPRALYELLAPASSLFVVTSLLVTALLLLPACRLAPLILPPPTPPPRRSHA